MARMTEKYHLVDLSNEVIDLGKDGSKWRHGYVPLNPAAVKLKMHGKPGKDESVPSVPKSKWQTNAEAAKARLAATEGQRNQETADSKRRFNALDNAGVQLSRSERQAYNTLSGPEKDRYISARTSGKTHVQAMSGGGISNPNAASMTNADKIKAAERMFGTGSPQHMAAKKKFGVKKGTFYHGPKSANSSH